MVKMLLLALYGQENQLSFLFLHGSYGKILIRRAGFLSNSPIFSYFIVLIISQN